MSEQQRELDQQLVDFTDHMEMGLEVDVESYHPGVQELVHTVQLIIKGAGVQMPGRNTAIRLKNRAEAAYAKEFKQNTSDYTENTYTRLKRLFKNFQRRPILQLSLITIVIIAALLLLPELNLVGDGLVGTAGFEQGQTVVLFVIFLTIALVLWLIYRRLK